jgi:protein translocase SecG subunit
MNTILLALQVTLASLLIVSILLQSSGTGMGATWSGGGETYHTRRGLEKVLFYGTIVMTVLFAATSLAMALL